MGQGGVLVFILCHPQYLVKYFTHINGIQTSNFKWILGILAKHSVSEPFDQIIRLSSDEHVFAEVRNFCLLREVQDSLTFTYLLGHLKKGLSPVGIFVKC